MKNKKNIYVVTRGFYSDYSIVGVFTSKKLAQLFIDRENTGEWSDNESIEVLLFLICEECCQPIIRIFMLTDT